MWSGGGVEGLTEPLFGGGVAPGLAGRHLWSSSNSLLDQVPDDQVSSSTSPSQDVVAVDLSLKSQAEVSEVALDGRRPSLQPALLEKFMKGNTPISRHERRISSDDEDSRLVIVEPIAEPESSGSPLPTPPPSGLDLIHSTTSVQSEKREFTSIKEVLLEMTNRKNGHAKLPPARWGIMKKDVEQAPKYIVEEKKTGFQRPTAMVNPFPAEGLAISVNGSSTLQTSITDWIQGKKDLASRGDPKNFATSKLPKVALRQRIPKGSSKKVISPKKKPLTAIVAELAGSVQGSQASQETSHGILQTLLVPTESFISSHRLCGGEVSISDVTPDVSVVDRLKRLGTVIEVEDNPESNSIKMLEKITKSVPVDSDSSTSIPVHHLTSQPLQVSTSNKLTFPHQLPVQFSQTNKKQVSKNNQTQHSGNQVSSQPNVVSQLAPVENKQLPIETGLNHRKKSQATLTKQITKSQSQSSIVQSNAIPLPKSVTSLSSSDLSKYAESTVASSNAQSSHQSLKIEPITITPKIQLCAQKPTANKKHKLLKHPLKNFQQKVQQVDNTQTKAPIVMPPIGTLYISKDVTLIPKLPVEPQVQDKIESSLFEPVIDIVEEENVLSSDGTFIFKTDSFQNADLTNEHKVYSCDICSAVYSHSNLLRKHYLRLHISRKHISEKDMETFNIDPEPANDNEKEILLYRCHTCRECFPTKCDLRSHLTDHPPVVESTKQSSKTAHPYYKCENCSTMFKWRKQFGKHKKSCKPLPPPPTEKPDLFHCLYCNETFSNGNAKRNHILSNHPYVRRKHCCVFCKRDGFPTNVSLFQHLLNDHPSVYFACQFCKERFTNLDELRAHADKKHDQDDSFKASLSERISTIKQEKVYYSCDTCQRKFLIENSFKEHVCFPEKQEKPKIQKIRKRVAPLSERLDRVSPRIHDMETIFYSRVAMNVRDNLLNYLDGKIYKDDSSEEDQTYGAPSPNVSGRTFLNFSAGFPSSSEIETDNGLETPARVKAQWEKYTFPKNYDGRCGLTSYIKDTSYLDISTQLIMRRNLQRLNMLPMKESSPNDVPSVLALERLSAECAESYGQLKEEKKEDVGEENQETISLSGEWVRDRMYVCSACRWESPCLWTMEDHKYLSHPRVHCPQHELIGDQTSLSKTIYKRLITDVPVPYKGPSPPTPPPLENITCTKCSKTGFSNQAELHVHILECAGVVVEPIGPLVSTRKKKRRTRRRPRRGLKRNIPSTPQKLPPKQRTKPGDTDTIERMIANLPAKRISKKVLSAYEEEKARQNALKNAPQTKGGKNKKSPGKRSQSEPPSSHTKEELPEHQVMLQRPTMIKKAQDYIDTSAEGGDVLSSLRMMPVRPAKSSVDPLPCLDSAEKKDTASTSQSDENEMPKLEIEKDISPVESAEIPVLSPIERKDDVKKERDDLICGISFVDGLIKYETVSSVSQEAEKLELNQRKRRSSSSNASQSGSKAKKSKLQPVSPPVLDVKIKDEPVDEYEINEQIKPESVPPKEVDKKSVKTKGGVSTRKMVSTRVSTSKKSPPNKKTPPTKKNSPAKVTPVKKEKASKEITPKKIISPKEPANKKNTSSKKPSEKKVTSKTNEDTRNESPSQSENVSKKNKSPNVNSAKKDKSKKSAAKKSVSPKERTTITKFFPKESKQKKSDAQDVIFNEESVEVNVQPMEATNTEEITIKTEPQDEIIEVTNESSLTECIEENTITQTNNSLSIDSNLPEESGIIEIKTEDADEADKENVVSTCVLPDDVTIKVEKSESVERDTLEGSSPSPKRRGRPKGSFNKKDIIKKSHPIGSRRSNRRSTKGEDDMIKFDEILPFEAEEKMVKMKLRPKPEPRVIKPKESLPVDTTTIVVQAEVHPVPVLKRKIADLQSDKCTQEADAELSAKKLKEMAIDETVNSEVSEEVMEPVQIKTMDVETSDIGNETLIAEVSDLSEQNDKVESSSGNEQEAEPDTSSALEENIERFQSKVTDTSNVSSESEAIVTTSVNDNQLAISEKEVDNSIEFENKFDSVYNVKDSPIEPLEIKNSCLLDAIDSRSVDEVTCNSSQDNKEIVHATEVSNSVDSIPQEPNNFTLKEEEAIPELQSAKKKKHNKKLKKKKKEESILEQYSNEEQCRKNSDVERIPDLEKPKKTKKLNKKDLSDIVESKKLKKTNKKKVVIKKIVKIKKRFLNKSNPVGEVLNIAGFKWEVSALESLPPVELNNADSEPTQSLPDSSVEEPVPDQPASSQPILDSSPQEPQASLAPPEPCVVAAPTPCADPTPSSLPSVPLPAPPAAPAPAPAPAQPAPEQTSTTHQTWDDPAPWEQAAPGASLGSILDSVNKLLNEEPENSYSPLGLPNYSLADLQKAMGVSDDEMAALQQLGEASLQLTSSETGSIKGGDNGDWTDEKCIMDLDNQPIIPHAPLKFETSTTPMSQPSPEPTEILKETNQDWRWREKSPVGSTSLLEAHQGKEVLCPSCCCHFMGFPALQRHLLKAHPTVGPKSEQKRGTGTTFSKTDLNRRTPLDSSQCPRLVCFSCQQILPADRMSLHLEQEHDISPDEVSKCSSLTGETHDGPVLGERLKSKMSSKLGDLLDRAVNNLLQAKHKPNNTLHGARELLSKLQRQQDGKPDDPDDPTKVFKTTKLFSCQICGLKFSFPSSRNKHEVLAHRSYRPIEYEAEEYENDWREAPSPPEAKGENGSETAIFPQCSDCGLSFDSIQDMMRHRVEDHSTRRSSVDASNSNTGGCPSPVPSSADSRSLPDSEVETAGCDSDSTGNTRRRRSKRTQRLSQSGSRTVKERAEAALRELNHPRLRPDNKRWLLMKQKAVDVYNFTDDSL